MRGTEFVRSLPDSGASQERDNAIVAAVVAGNVAPLSWAPLAVKRGGKEATIFVMRDAIKIGEPGDYVRISMNADAAQRVAWALKAYLPTTRICDSVWDASTQITPCIQGPPRYSYNDMDSPERMIDYHQQVERKVGTKGGVIGNVGKHWVLTNANIGSQRVRNYGWYVERGWSVSASGKRMIQTLGAAHNSRHADYSQVVRLVKDEIVVEGVVKTFAEVALDPELAQLISSEGVLRKLYLPSAEKWKDEDSQQYKERPSDPSITVPPDSPEKRPSEPVERLVISRLLYRGCIPANDVGDWQAFVKVTTDNKFGPVTQGATFEFQATTKSLKVDGIVGPKTLAAANQQLEQSQEIASEITTPPSPAVQLDHSKISFKQARNYTWATRVPGDVIWIVIHSMESSEKPTVAEAVASWFAGTNAPRASAHYNVDNDSIVHSVKCEHVAWHAPGANRLGIGIEHAGRARQNHDDWFDEYSRAMLEKMSVPLCAYLCQQWDIPPRFVGREGLKEKTPGITTHHEVSQAFGKSNHWDPGPAFPVEWYLQQVGALLGK